MRQLATATHQWIRSRGQYNNFAMRMSLPAIVLILVFVGTGCTNPADRPGNDSPVIDQLVVEHPVLYPLGNTRIECIAADSQNRKLAYKWVCNNGKIIGDGAEITWEAPATYGDFPIMVTVDDGNGNTVNKIATVSVIVRGSTQPGCASCPK